MLQSVYNGICNSTFFEDAVSVGIGHPLCHLLCNVTIETSGATKITINAIDLWSIAFRWNSSWTGLYDCQPDCDTDIFYYICR